MSLRLILYESRSFISPTLFILRRFFMNEILRHNRDSLESAINSNLEKFMRSIDDKNPHHAFYFLGVIRAQMGVAGIDYHTDERMIRMYRLIEEELHINFVN